MAPRTRRMWATTVLCGLVLAMRAGAGPGDAQDEKATVTTHPTPQTLPEMPSIRLGPPRPFSNEAAYLDTKRTESRRLADLAEAESDPLVQSRYLLAAANTLLSFLVEPACSRKFLSLDAPNPDKRSWYDVLNQAERLLAQADDTIVEVKSGDEKKDTALRNLQRASESLHAFHGALKTYLVEDTTKGKPSATRRRAASKLSPLLEDADARIVAAARFWQAVLRQGSSEPKRLLQLLKPVMADLVGESTHAFYSRLLSCRLMASSREFVSAIALLMQLQVRCDQWFANEVDRADAVRAVALFQIRILADWYRHLEKDEAARAWCVDRIEKIKATHFSGEDNTVLRLSPAIPSVVTAEEREHHR